ncbi:MAG: right-handed parallel beta-helix repeat-containing protein, partial [Mycobacterium sp.]|nr:right-handed parallel beta-helix repeat-containing protein [Mycobacterium sp.]
ASLRGTGITFEDFVVQGNTNNGPGVSTYGGTANWNGYTIRDNLIQNNVYGLLFGGAAGPATSIATHNCFISNNQPGSTSGTGIYVSNPVTAGPFFGISNGTISDNILQTHNNVSILIDGGNANNTVTGNTIAVNTGGNGIGIYQSTGGQISNNVISNQGGAGIFLCGTSGLTVDNNTVTGRNPGPSRGIQAFGTATCANIGAPLPLATPNMNLTVENNTVLQNGDSGFRADANAVFNSTISGNQFTHNFIGIRVTAVPNTGNTFANNQIIDSDNDGIRFFAADNTIENNVITSNGRIGIALQVGGANAATGNQVLSNQASNNAVLDCQDQSTGSGTAGTANTWTGNFGSTAQPSSVGDVGICPFVTTQATATVTLPSTLTDTATVSFVVPPPPGNVTFTLYGPFAAGATPDCVSGPVADTSTVPVTPTGSSPDTGTATSAPFTPSTPGTYYWIANYVGGPGVQPSSAITTCGEAGETSTVEASISTAATPTTHPGGALSDTATLVGNPDSMTGTVNFTVYGPSTSPTPATCETVAHTFTGVPVTPTSTGGTATSPDFHPTAAGYYFWVASYSGDPFNGAPSTACG